MLVLDRAAACEPVMARLSSTSALSDIDLKPVHVAVEWPGPGGLKRYLYQHSLDPSRQVACDVHFNSISGAALFKLKVQVELKALPSDKMRTPLLLYVQGDRITALEYDVPKSVPDTVGAKLGTAPSRLQFSLAKPADIVGSLVSLAPRNVGHGDTINFLKIPAQETSFSIYLSRKSLSESLFRPICETSTRGGAHLSRHGCKHARALRRCRCQGRGFEGAEFGATVPPTSMSLFHRMNSRLRYPPRAPPKPRKKTRALLSDFGLT